MDAGHFVTELRQFGTCRTLNLFWGLVFPILPFFPILFPILPFCFSLLANATRSNELLHDPELSRCKLVPRSICLHIAWLCISASTTTAAQHRRRAQIEEQHLFYEMAPNFGTRPGRCARAHSVFVCSNAFFVGGLFAVTTIFICSNSGFVRNYNLSAAT